VIEEMDLTYGLFGSIEFFFYKNWFLPIPHKNWFKKNWVGGGD
jgi:hypothetical protein